MPLGGGKEGDRGAWWCSSDGAGDGGSRGGGGELGAASWRGGEGEGGHGRAGIIAGMEGLLAGGRQQQQTADEGAVTPFPTLGRSGGQPTSGRAPPPTPPSHSCFTPLAEAVGCKWAASGLQVLAGG